MDAMTHMALAGLALCDALDEGATDAGARIKAVDAARRHYHAVIGQQHGILRHDPCVCPDEARADCHCIEECICAAMAQGE